MAEQVTQRRRLWVFAILVLLLAAAAVAHQTRWWTWYIEDAAISFAYARNWADGYGLVALPDTERLEGYSNFTWVVLLSIFELVGIDGFTSSKWMQVVLGFATVPLTALIAREATTRPDGTPVVAAGYLATASTFAVWGACGLENGLFNFLVALALWRSAVELRTEASMPWSALVWCLVAMSRPEAVLYCAIAGFLMMVFTLRRGLGPTLKWLALFWVPFGLYHAVRYWYFAYEFPQTYYGKMTNKQPSPLAWNRRGWKEVRGWSHTLWTGYYLPLYAFGLTGWRGAKGAVTAVALLVAGAWLLFPEVIPRQPLLVGDLEVAPLILPQDFPSWWEEGRSYLMAFFAAFLPVVALGRRDRWWVWSLGIALAGAIPLAGALAIGGAKVTGPWILMTTIPALALAGAGLWRSVLQDPPDVPTQVRVLCWGVGCGVLFFAIYTQGDWMKAWRWMSLLQVPLAVVFATGVGVAADALETAVGKLAARLPDKVPEWLPPLGVWSVLQLVVVILIMTLTNRFAHGTSVALGIGGGAVLLALPLGAARNWLDVPWSFPGWALAGALTALTAFPNLDYSHALRNRPETGPFSVKNRVDFVKTIRDKLEIEHRIVDLDVDQGAHLWWGRDAFRMHDLAGLVDIPLAQHRFKRSFLREYLFEEARPHFAHVHGGWATNSRIRTHPEWTDQYVEIPGFPAGSRSLHIGNFVRRDLFLKSTYPHGEPVPMTSGVVFHGFRIPSEPGTRRNLWLEVAVQDQTRRQAGQELNITVLARRDGQIVQMWNVPMAYGWLQHTDFRPDDVFVGNFDLDTRHLEPGDYDVGFAFWADGAPSVPLGDRVPGVEAPTAPPVEDVLAQGPDAWALWYDGALTVVERDRAAELAAEDVQGAIERAKKGDCEGAAEQWQDATRHLPIDQGFRSENQSPVHAAIAACWASRAEQAEDPVPALLEARLWNHQDPTYRRLRAPLASEMEAQGKQALDGGDWETAYALLSKAVAVDPTRSWSRRWAEQARSMRLDLANEDNKGR